MKKERTDSDIQANEVWKHVCVVRAAETLLLHCNSRLVLRQRSAAIRDQRHLVNMFNLVHLVPLLVRVTGLLLALQPTGRRSVSFCSNPANSFAIV